MQQHRRRSGFIVGLLSLGLFATAALTAGPAQADSAGPYYATPSWDQTLPAATRFIVLSNFANAAVLDRETGLVWEKSPDTTPVTFQTAEFNGCIDKNVGGRKGWRLPSFVELASLIDPSVALPGPALPTGHPFLNVQFLPVPGIGLPLYWSATVQYLPPFSCCPSAWAVSFGSHGSVGNGGDMLTNFNYQWCVRGPMNTSVY